jgi:hypothetical protein
MKTDWFLWLSASVSGIPWFSVVVQFKHTTRLTSHSQQIPGNFHKGKWNTYFVCLFTVQAHMQACILKGVVNWFDNVMA